jgi:hypothetical protein
LPYNPEFNKISLFENSVLLEKFKEYSLRILNVYMILRILNVYMIVFINYKKCI